MISADEGTEVEWKVTWFPPDRAEVTKTGSEALVRRVAEKMLEHNPIIESREVVVTEWRLVENLADRT